ncbi:mRNA 3'-end-processing protein rna14 [Clydaea vesicula]|uniref:mRNA 3'-end-processing protein rna14 n=1 Tax=Clydaea vesicula TaxID=447962 RepID=A0AAD5U8D5_9FUNG|nr:mRNA 3'-end-processing protein rna14 [Clydaea vesicula]
MEATSGTEVDYNMNAMDNSTPSATDQESVVNINGSDFSSKVNFLEKSVDSPQQSDFYNWEAENSQKPLFKVEKIKQALKSDIYNDILWEQLLQEAKNTNEEDVIRQAYDEFLKVFPTSSRHWIEYATFEQDNSAFDKVESIFNKCLRSVVSVDLWKFYLSYIQKNHSLTNQDTLQENRTIINNTFEFVLSNVGFDPNSSSIWSDYINFIKSGECNPASYEYQVKIDKLRKIYQQATVTPIANIEQLWKDYDSFENGLNKITAKKFISERSSGYMTARTALREITGFMENIEKAQSSFLPKPVTWSETDCKLLELWKRYIAWEKSNPLNIDDKTHLFTRVMYTYNSALLKLRYFPEIWVEAAKFLISQEKFEEALKLLKTGIETIPTSLLIAFTLVEFEEGRNVAFKEISQIFEKLIQNLESKIDEKNAKFDEEVNNLLKRGNKSVKNNKIADGMEVEDLNEEVWDGESREREREQLKQLEKEIHFKVEETRKIEIDLLKEAVSCAYIMYMRVARRESEKSARLVFGKARKSSHCNYQVYVYSALMEYHCSKDHTIAGKVFELSLKAFLNDAKQAEFVVLHYLDFLHNSNDETNARAVFERAITTLPLENLKSIWKKMLEHENLYGEFNLINNLEKRRKEMYHDNLNIANDLELEDLKDLSKKYSFKDITYIEDEELGIPEQLQHQQPKFQASTFEAKSINRLQTLAAVTPEKFVRPDLTKWQTYKSDPNQKLMVSERNLNSNSPASSPRPDLGNSSPKASHQIPPSSSNTLHTTPSYSQFAIPPAISALLCKLPSPSYFQGPVFNVDDMLDLINKLPLSLPNQQLDWITYVPPSTSDVASGYGIPPFSSSIPPPFSSHSYSSQGFSASHGTSSPAPSSSRRDEHRSRPYDRDRRSGKFLLKNTQFS